MNEPTTVINVASGQLFHVYVGRANKSRGLPRSPWANPFLIGRDGDRAAVIAKYEQWLWTQPRLRARLPELRGKVLACWCRPRACHGDVLARLADAAPVASDQSSAVSS